MVLADNEYLSWEGTDNVVKRRIVLPGMTSQRNIEHGELVMLNGNRRFLGRL